MEAEFFWGGLLRCGRCLVFIGVVALGLALTGGFAGEGPYPQLRKQMVDQDLVGRGITHAKVIQVMGKLSREEFVPIPLKAKAYGDYPLPIGHGQTISQPYIVAYMTEVLLNHAQALGKVLEVGTGSGYQAAVLGELFEKVYTLEIIQPLAESSARTLKRVGAKNVEVKFGDGYLGWPEHAPYDAIIVTAASPDIPPPLIHQLSPQGAMILPVGTPFGVQHLVLVQRDEKGAIRTRNLLPVAFVPLTRLPSQASPKSGSPARPNPSPNPLPNP
jgi:protein-L-isoaspartate(D-aspartate) O-methyltransferase